MSTAHDASWYAREFDQLLRYKVCTNFPRRFQVIRTKRTADPVGTAAWPIGIMTRSFSEAWTFFKYCELSRIRGSLCDLCFGAHTTVPLNSQRWTACKLDRSPMLATCHRPEDCGTGAPLYLKNLACKSTLCRFEIRVCCGGKAACFHVRTMWDARKSRKLV